MQTSHSRILRGMPVCPGTAAGYLVPVTSPSTVPADLQGAIALIPALRTDLVVQLWQCKGIVARAGGLCCHGASVIRELGIPCVVVDVPQELSTKRAEVLLNGSNGVLEFF